MFSSRGGTFVLVLIGLFAFCLSDSYAAVKSGMISPKDLKTNLKKKKQDVQKIEVNQRKIMGNLYRLNLKIKKMATKRSRLSDRMIAVKGNVKGLARSIFDIEQLISIQRKQLSRRMRRIYKSGAQTMLQSIFSSSSAFELDKNLEFMRRVSQRDYELIKGYEASLRALESKRKKLKIEVRSLVKVKGRLKKQESSLEKTQRSKSTILAKLRVRKKRSLKQLRKIRLRSKQIKSRGLGSVSALFEESIFERKGHLMSPVPGPPERDFGLLIHPKHRYRLSHKGHFYGAAVGTDIKSIFRGKVQFIGNITGYGKTVILSHGDHYYSLYSQLSHVAVIEDSKVSEGAVIGRAGLGKRDMGAGVYFELRHFSEPVDPAKWFKVSGRTQQAQAGGGRRE